MDEKIATETTCLLNLSDGYIQFSPNGEKCKVLFVYSSHQDIMDTNYKDFSFSMNIYSEMYEQLKQCSSSLNAKEVFRQFGFLES